MTEIVTQTEVGRHNSNLELAAGRVLEGGSWKKQRVIVIMPSSSTIPAKVVLSWLNLIYPPNNAAYRMPAEHSHRMLCLGMEVGHAYNSAIETALAHPELSQWEYILTIEADNMPPPDGLLKLLAQMEKHPELSCIGGLYWTKGEGGMPQIWGDIRDPVLNFRPQVPRAGELVECCGTGMGFNLWRTSMFKDAKLRKPWFVTQASKEGVGTQDLYFWTDARKHGHRCAIDCDVRVGHFDSRTDICW